MAFHFSYRFLLLATVVFLLEVFIAVFIKDTLVRPFIGDVLVVVLIFSIIKSFVSIPCRKLAFGVLLFACLIEILQYFDYVKLLGLENNRILSIAMGRTFEWLDFAAYFIGFLLIIVTETYFKQRKTAATTGSAD